MALEPRAGKSDALKTRTKSGDAVRIAFWPSESFNTPGDDESATTYEQNRDERQLTLIPTLDNLPSADFRLKRATTDRRERRGLSIS